MPLFTRASLLALATALSACQAENIAPLQVNILVPKGADVNAIQAYRAQVEYEGGDTTGLIFQYTLTPGENNAGLRAGLPTTDGDERIQVTIEGLVEDAATSTDEDPLLTPLFRGASGPHPLTADAAPLDIFVGRVNALNELEETLSDARDWGTVTWLGDGTALIAGGAREDGGAAPSVDRFDSGWSSGQFGPQAIEGAMQHARVHHTATLYTEGGGSQVLIAGGDTRARLSFAPVTLTDEAGTSYTLTLPQINASAQDIITHDTAELFDPEAGQPGEDLSMPLPLSLHQAAALPNGGVLLCGGLSPVDGASVVAPSRGCLIFDEGVFKADVINMDEARLYHQLTALQNGSILITGGIDSSTLDQETTVKIRAELYQAGSTTAQAAGQLAIARAGHSAVLLPSGRVLITGGFGYERTPSGPQGQGGRTRLNLLGSVEVFDPSLIGTGVNSRPSQPAGFMVYPRAFHSSVVLSEDLVLIVGGVGLDTTDPLPPELYSIEDGTFTPLEGDGVAAVLGTAVTLVPDNGTVLLSGGRWYDTAGAQTGLSSLHLFVPQD